MSEQLVLGDVPAAAWDDFHAGRPGAIPGELAACWARAQTLGAPLDGADPDELLLRGDALRGRAGHLEVVHAMGAAILERAAARVSARDFLLLLADPDGVVVRSSGGGGFAEAAARMRLIAGACWSEAARGTNAIGTAAAANRPTEVHGHAHFGRRYHELVCYAAPVRGPDGRVRAVLDATSRLDRADPEIGRAVIRAARSLEELVRWQAYGAVGASAARALRRSLDRMRDPALWIEAPGTIARASASARALLGGAGPDVEAALGLGWPALLAEAVAPAAGGRDLELARRTWRLRVEPVAAGDGAVLAMLVVLEPARPRPRPAPVERCPAGFDAIFARDPVALAAIELAGKLAPHDLPVMLLAETGAGKELFAQAIHAASPRAGRPFHAVNCGALAPGVLEAELFGYAPGAFTGADRAGRTGMFHAAAGGTLFLDEVAEMSPAMQAAMLRVLETGAFRRVGEVRLEHSDVRLVCATCRDLAALVAAGGFRQDLYYRLKGAVVRIPPLRERTDTVALAQHLLGGRAELAPDAEAAIARHGWPGNVRELKSMLAVAQALAPDGRIELAHLAPELAGVARAPSAGLEVAEREALVCALAEARGNVSRAARLLGVARSTLHRMKRRHDLP